MMIIITNIQRMHTALSTAPILFHLILNAVGSILLLSLFSDEETVLKRSVNLPKFMQLLNSEHGCSRVE